MARVHVCFVSFRFPFYACCCTLPELTVADSFSLDTRSHSGGTKRHWLQRHAGDVGPVYKWTEESEKYKQGKPSCIMMLEAHSGQCQRYPFVDFPCISVKSFFSLSLSLVNLKQQQLQNWDFSAVYQGTSLMVKHSTSESVCKVKKQRLFSVWV